MKKLVLALGVTLAVALFACVTFRNAIEDKLPSSCIRILRAPESMELLALDPRPIDARPVADRNVPSERVFHGYEILGHAPLIGVKPRRKLTEVVFKGILESDGKVAACFNPRHGLRAVREGQVVDLLICYECLQVEVHGPGKKESALTSDSVEPEVTRIYQVAGLTIAPR
jgi:hypothetical protein